MKRVYYVWWWCPATGACVERVKWEEDYAPELGMEMIRDNQLWRIYTWATVWE